MSKLWAAVIALGAFVLGIVLMIVGNATTSVQWLSALLTQLGGVIIASVALAVVFQYILNAYLLQEFFGDVRTYELIDQARVLGIWPQFEDVIDWRDLLTHTSTFVVFNTYASRWRQDRLPAFRDFLSDASHSLRVVLPDYQNQKVVAAVCARASLDEDYVCAHIRRAVRDYQGLNAECPGTVEVLLSSSAPVFTFYLADRKAVLALFTHRQGARFIPRQSVITLLVGKGGGVYEYLLDELDALIDASAPAPDALAVAHAAEAILPADHTKTPGHA